MLDRCPTLLSGPLLNKFRLQTFVIVVIHDHERVDIIGGPLECSVLSLDM
jgi:hypothetical protein